MVTKLYYVIACRGSCSIRCNTVEYLLTTGELVMAIGSDEYEFVTNDKSLQTLGVGVLHRGKK
jgi:hypothetical protein